MRHPGERRDSKAFVVVDEDCGIPESLVENYRGFDDNGPLAHSDPRTVLLSMSEYDKSQSYDVYDYPAATRPDQPQAYSAFPTHPPYTTDYVGAAHAQVPSGLPQPPPPFNPIPNAQSYQAPDPTYYSQQDVPYSTYVEIAPRPLPHVVSFAPTSGQPGTKVTVYLRSAFDLDTPQVTPVIMFGQKRCQSILTKSVHPGQQFEYTLTVDAPPLTPAASPSPQVPLSLTFDQSPVTWDPPSLDFGSFSYLDQPTFYPVQSPEFTQRKRKLSTEASPRRSPTKKPSLHHITGPASAMPQSNEFRRPSLPDSYSQIRRFSGPEPQTQSYSHHNLPRMQSQQFWSTGQTTPSLQSTQSPSWSYPHYPHSATRSPSAAAMSTGSKASLLPSPASGTNPQLIRTSTIHQSPTIPGPAAPPTHNFNPYAMYPSNSKAQLKIDGDLSTMSLNWTEAEWEAGRRLVQFRRVQSGSVITATFEAVTPEDRIPNSICVSCIYWKERSECYVTSVDTISLLESLVGVRFTVEEKNRIRRNLEGFRPATVSKTKQDSEEFFKLIMGFPNPKPRNIEKDVKVFPWRILAGALRKIIGKYSASYSSTAGALPTPGAGPGYSGGRPSDVGIEHAPNRPIASPLSTSSSATSHGNAYAPNVAAHVYSSQALGATGLGIGAVAGPPELRLAVPGTATSQATSWHQPSANYTSDLSGSGRGSWEFPSSYLSASPAVGLPTTAQPYPYSTAQPIPPQARFVPLHGYDEQSHQTTNGQ